MDLFVRAGRNDNRVIEELMAPATAGVPFAGRRVPMRTLVIDAPTAAVQPALREAAEAAGLPLLIDPLTHLFQDEQAPASAWATLEFAAPQAHTAQHFADDSAIATLVQQSLAFQLDHGASILVPPYFYAKSPDDPWFRIQIAANQRTAEYLAGERINLPVAPVFAGNLKAFGSQRSWAEGVEEFLRSLAKINVRYVPVALSSSRSPLGDTEDRLGAYLATVRHMGAAVPIIAWRQGQYGLAAVAAGAVGYQTGLGTDERCDLAEFTRARRPKPPPEPGKGPQMTKRIYLGRFGRSVSSRVAEVLLNSGYLRGTLTCADPVCCPDGVSSMTSGWRQHAVRARSRELDELHRMPDSAWRLNHVARLAERAADDARAANQVLAQADVADRLPEASFRALTTVADALRDMSDRRAG
ncbi:MULTISPECIES: hypothetical protein [Mycobacterium]|uniref:Uncharacterized protein n=1 Tax=Mycobacterium intracellulare 1956 TaxID=1299331 RepID=X8CS12_MYCIT|nr:MULTISPECIES: hypothetical protein [Mycobacterium]EUA58651.1 hypothetical protein I550_1794 [Mycobacterium intracellulare 1956]ASW88162.1 hypothetical protein CKJ61_09350 [Mycobacterium intracellulare]MCA2252105.1 hypothetical protein [Mycobacterium intracellulare]MCA2302917.1 hypothetical protein [Mycobacterium intracellulare]MCA2345491.1 hypothetical protein [Mycobacterium intracellulare]